MCMFAKKKQIYFVNSKKDARIEKCKKTIHWHKNALTFIQKYITLQLPSSVLALPTWIFPLTHLLSRGTIGAARYAGQLPGFPEFMETCTCSLQETSFFLMLQRYQNVREKSEKFLRRERFWDAFTIFESDQIQSCEVDSYVKDETIHENSGNSTNFVVYGWRNGKEGPLEW